MSNDTDTVAESTDVEVPESAETETTEQAEPAPKPRPGTESLPDWVKDELKASRETASREKNRAGRASSSLRKATEENAVLKEQVARLEAELGQIQLDRVKAKAASDAGISGESAADFVDMLTGSTPEDIAAQAEKLARNWRSAAAMPVDRSSHGTETVDATNEEMWASIFTPKR